MKCWRAVLQVDVGVSWSAVLKQMGNDQPALKHKQQVAALWHANTQRIVELQFQCDLMCIEGAGREGEGRDESVLPECVHAHMKLTGLRTKGH